MDIWMTFSIINFQANVHDWWLSRLWNCPQMNVTEPYTGDDKSTLVHVMARCSQTTAITWTSEDEDLGRHVASLGHNKLSMKIQNQCDLFAVTPRLLRGCRCVESTNELDRKKRVRMSCLNTLCNTKAVHICSGNQKSVPLCKHLQTTLFCIC